MLQQLDLQELAERGGERPPILSLYLNVAPQRGVPEEYRLRLRKLLGQAALEGAASEDIARVERFFDHEYPRQGRSVACFSHQKTDFWRVYTLMVPVKDFAFVGSHPYIKPLSDVLDEYDRFGVITVDREGARAFVYHLGTLEDSGGTMGTELKRHKQGGWSAQKLQRHEDDEAKHNLKAAAEWADQYLREHGVTRVVLSGSDGNVALFREYLPNQLQARVIGQVTLDMNASPGEVWERSLEVAQQAQRQSETALLEQIVTMAHKGTSGVIGLGDTLAALEQGRAYHLLVARDLHAAGQQCSHCRAVVIDAFDACPYCNHELRPAGDVVNLAVQRAVECGIRVSIVDKQPALEQVGGMAAVLRY